MHLELKHRWLHQMHTIAKSNVKAILNSYYFQKCAHITSINCVSKSRWSKSIFIISINKQYKQKYDEQKKKLASNAIHNNIWNPQATKNTHKHLFKKINTKKI